METYTRARILAWLRGYAEVVAAEKDRLTALDAAIGDADHGANLDRGMRAVVAKLPAVEDKDVGTILKTVGMTLVSTVGGASGPLLGTLFLQLGATTAGKAELSLADWVAAWKAGVNGVMSRGKAVPGDKTMVDALAPARDALREALAGDESLVAALHNAAEAADQGARDTIPLVARRGRASYLGERSVGHQDPGATSSALLVRAAADALAAEP